MWVSIPLPSLTKLTCLVLLNHHQSLHFHPLATQQATAPPLVSSQWEGMHTHTHTRTHARAHTHTHKQKKHCHSWWCSLLTDAGSLHRLEIQSQLTWMIEKRSVNWSCPGEERDIIRWAKVTQTGRLEVFRSGDENSLNFKWPTSAWTNVHKNTPRNSLYEHRQQESLLYFWHAP